MPRIRNWKDLKFYKPYKESSYEHIDVLFKDTVRWDIIETHFEDIFQVILSIKAGKIMPSTLLRKLNNYSKKNKLFQAFRELGNVIRTMYLLDFISDIELREKITESTNKTESYNAFASWSFFGGNVLYIKSLDRLGRNKQMILDEWNELVKVKKVDIVILDMTLLDTTKYKDMNGLENLISDIILQLLSYMTEDERLRTKEIQREGIKIAREKGIKFGRRKIDPGEKFEEVYKEWKAGQITDVKAIHFIEE